MAVRVDGKFGAEEGISLHALAGSVLLFARHAALTFEALGYSGSIVVHTSLDSILGVNWLKSDVYGYMSAHSGAELDDSIQFELASSARTLLENPDSIVMDILRPNWPDLVDSREKLEGVLHLAFTTICGVPLTDST